MTLKSPSAELVMQAFLSTQVDATWSVTTTLPALEVLDQKRLPKDNWGGRELWVTPTVYGSAFTLNVPVRRPVVGLSVWCKPVDKRRHWGKAMDLAEQLVDLGIDWTQDKVLAIPYPGYSNVNLHSFSPVSAPRRIPGDPQGLARVDVDVQLAYSILKFFSGNVLTPVVTIDNTTRYDFTSSTSWNLTHHLGYFPIVEVFDFAGNEIEGAVTQINQDSLIINFDIPVSGFVLVR